MSIGIVKLILAVAAALLAAFDLEARSGGLPASVVAWAWLPPILQAGIAAALAGMDRIATAWARWRHPVRLARRG